MAWILNGSETTAGDHALFIGEVIEQGLLAGGPFFAFRADEFF